jgi:hypothetical protein
MGFVSLSTQVLCGEIVLLPVEAWLDLLAKLTINLECQ